MAWKQQLVVMLWDGCRHMAMELPPDAPTFRIGENVGFDGRLNLEVEEVEHDPLAQTTSVILDPDDEKDDRVIALLESLGFTKVTYAESDRTDPVRS